MNILKRVPNSILWLLLFPPMAKDNILKEAKKCMDECDYDKKMKKEELVGKQYKLDKNHNGKIDGQDLAILRGQKKTNEETEQIDELSKDTLNSYVKKSFSDKEKSNLDTAQRQKGLRKATSRLYKEEQIEEDIEQIQEYESKDGKYVHKGTYGYEGKGAEYGSTEWDKEEKLAKKHLKDKPARKKYGARQNYVRSNRVNEFTDMINLYKEGGLKSLSEAWAKKKMMKEEPTQDEYEKEIDDQKKKATGEKKQPEVAKPSVQAVQNEETHTEVQVIDMTDPDNIQKEVINLANIDERSMTEPEMKKREEIVKSMKKGIAGFKERYGERAKNVMYATATKQAMKD